MYRNMIALFLLGLWIGLTPMDAVGQNPYEQFLKPKGFTASAVVLPARTVGKTVLRAQTNLAVEIQIQVEDYLPRSLEPTLLIDGIPANVTSGVVSTEGRITTLSFLVEKPELLKEGATLALQMGDNVSRVPGVLHRQKIQPEAKRLGLPMLEKWLGQTRPRRNTN